MSDGHQKSWTLNENFVSSHSTQPYKIVSILKLFSLHRKNVWWKALEMSQWLKILKSIFEQFYATSRRFIFIFMWWVRSFFFIVRLLCVCVCRICAPFNNNIAVVITFYFVIIFDDMYWIFNKRTQHKGKRACGNTNGVRISCAMIRKFPEAW